MHRAGRHHQDIAQGVHLKPDIDELVGKQLVVAIGKFRLELEGAGRQVDAVVGTAHPADREFDLLLAVPGLDHQGLTGLELAADLTQIGLWHGEHHGNRLRLRNADQAGAVAGMHHIAQIDLFETQATADRRADFGVRELQLGVVDLGLIGLYRSHQLARQGILGLHLLLGNGILGQQVFIARQVQLRVAQLRHIARQLTLRLRQRNLITARIDLGQQGASAHGLAFFEMDGFEFAIDTRAYRRGVQGCNIADGRQNHPHVLAFGRHHRHRLGAVGATKTTATARRTGRRVRTG